MRGRLPTLPFGGSLVVQCSAVTYTAKRRLLPGFLTIIEGPNHPIKSRHQLPNCPRFPSFLPSLILTCLGLPAAALWIYSRIAVPVPRHLFFFAFALPNKKGQKANTAPMGCGSGRGRRRPGRGAAQSAQTGCRVRWGDGQKIVSGCGGGAW